jgi:hypothetical protein
LRSVSGLQRMNHAITEVLRVRLHTSHFARNGPDMQLQTALISISPEKASFRERCSGLHMWTRDHR